MIAKTSEVAKEIRKELKANFPNHKFQVLSDGNTVNINWDDGNKEEDVKKLVNKYEYGDYDGMQDMFIYKETKLNLPQCKYVFCNRRMSENARDRILNKWNNSHVSQINDYNAYNNDYQAWNNNLIYREFYKTSFDMNGDDIN